MNFIIENWMLISIALRQGGLLFWPVLQGATVAGIEPGAVVQLINREKAVVVDVCEVEEFAAGHLGAAKNIPLSDFEANCRQIVSEKASPLVLVCQPVPGQPAQWRLPKSWATNRPSRWRGGLAPGSRANLPVEKA